ncbi:P-loop containing nucleoside triphosphate hydrolase protein [Massariosphaeria phaeospora]|uniref:DNA 3'-5' helicase n=1 Tax=Massariosphaeria phaeospora TaxID=100035 RepID=A0A7C8MFR7_9PLEO|nr:P-loop containing nucleoside triphosphate hydrolase protein [Massariosphaeria phaeospora]
MDILLDGLNAAQKSAVTSPASVVQVLAPPGSGKTKTLTARVAYLVNHERLQPWNIIVCTFTIKAAREMKERIQGMVGDKVAAKLILGTFHSVARRFLVRYGQEIGVAKNFGIADTSDSKAIIKRIIDRNQYGVEASQARGRISGLKAKGISAEQFAATTKKVDQHEFACVYSEYEDTLKVENLLDYDDLLLRCVDLLEKAPASVSSIQAVLIDEYQDTNNVQYRLMKLMAQKMKRVTIVGDPDQSIYSFRSAEIKNLLRMRVDYPESVVINLERNYRSSGCILSSAMAVIEQDESRPNKPVIATHCVGEQPTLRHLATAHIEAQWIVEEIHRTKTLTSGLLNYSDYAILLRSAALSLSIERALGKAGIPYRMVGGKRFFDRAEIKIVLDYLRVINQPNHNDALIRVINLPSRKIGDTTVKAMLEEAEVRKITLWKLILDCAQGKSTPKCKISKPAQQGIDTFVNIILTSRRKLLPADNEECNLLDLISYILQKISFEAYLKSTHKDNWQERWANVEELVVQATQMAAALADGEEVSDDALPVVEGIEQRQDTAADILSKFLANVALSTEIEKPDGEEPNQVTISTIHAAKGLEWPIVFIPAVYDGSIPHSRAEDHDEERRLLYDLAQILRRPCPSGPDVQVAGTLLERIDDDKFPASREEIDGEDTSWKFSKTNGEGGTQSSKRRKIEASTTSLTEYSITMQESTGFTIASTTLPSGNGGFTSARVLQEAVQEAEAVRMLASANDAASGKAAYEQAKRTEVKPARTKAVKPRAAGQGSITSFFTGPGRTLSSAPDIAATRVPSLKRSQSSVVQHNPLTDISNVANQTSRPMLPYQPPSLSSYRPRSTPMAGKPKKTEAEPDAENTKYILLSSSPVKPVDDSGAGPPKDVEELVRKEAPSPTRQTSGFRPASTFHSTSVGQLQNQIAPQRRTLGTRRTLQPWSAKHNPLPRPGPRQS